MPVNDTILKSLLAETNLNNQDDWFAVIKAVAALPKPKHIADRLRVAGVSEHLANGMADKLYDEAVKQASARAVAKPEVNDAQTA